MSPSKGLGREDAPTRLYFVGDHAEVAALLRGLVRAGVDTIILDLPPVEEELENVRQAVALANLNVVRAR